ncbi:MAG: Ig-like domain repeat protein [Candidatus Hadarchaeales archaeon]
MGDGKRKGEFFRVASAVVPLVATFLLCHLIPYPSIRLADGSFVSEPLLSALSPFLLAAALSLPLLRTRGLRSLLLLSSALLLLLSLRLYLVPSGFVPHGSSFLLYPTLPLKSCWQPLLLSSLLLSLPLLGLRRSLILFLSLPLALHASLLSAPATRAATVTIAATEDCAVSRLYPSTSFDYIGDGSYTPSNYALRVETYSWLLTDSDWRSYFQFNLSSLADPSGYTRVINSAYLYLYVMYADLSIESREHWVLHDTSDWTMPYTWNSQPLGSGSNPSSGIIADFWFYGSSTEQYLYNAWTSGIDVTSAVRANKGSTLTIGIRDGDEDAWAYGIWTEFAAVEKGSSYAAYLSVNYTDWPGYEKVPDPECSGGSWATSDDSGNVSGTWPDPSWIPGSATGWSSSTSTATAMWNTVNNIIDQKTKIVYHTSYEQNDPVTGPNPPNVGYAYYSYPSDGEVHWFWDESTTWPNSGQREGYSYTWAPCKNITDYTKIYSSTLYVRWYAWTDDFDGSQANAYLQVQLLPPGASTWDAWTIAQYANGTWGSANGVGDLNTGWQLWSSDMKSYLQNKALNGSYKIKLYSFNHADCDAGDVEHFAWWVDYVHFYVYEDAIPPSITLSVSPSKEWYPNNTTITFSWSATDSESGLNSSPYAYAMDDIPSSWGTATWASYNTANLPEGIHTFYVKARDGGETMLVPNEVTASFTFKVDKTPPSISFIGQTPLEGSWSSSTSITFEWSASDNLSGVQGYKYSLDNGPWTDTPSTSYTWSGLSDGGHTFRVRAYDQAGNYTEITRNFWVDATVPPAPVVSSSTHPNPGTWYPSLTVTVSWSCSDTAPIDNYSYVFNQNPDTLPDDGGEGIDNSYTFTVSGDGIWYFHVRARNAAGLWGSAAHFALYIDNTPPSSPTLFSPTHPNQAAWYGNNDPCFEWSRPDDISGIVGYSYALDETPDDTVDLTENSVTLIDVPNGTHIFYVKALNGAGLWSSSASYTVNIDNTPPPAPDVSSPTHPDQNAWYSSRTVSMNWSCSDISGIIGYYYYWGTDPAGSPTTWTTSTSADLTASSDGTWYFRIYAVNGSGFPGSIATFTVHIETTPPPAPAVFSPTHPDPNSWYPDNNPTFSWSCDAPDIVGYSYALDADPDNVVDTSENSVSLPVPEEIHTFYVKAKNSAGLWGPAGNFTVKVDVTAPSAPIGLSVSPATWTNVNSFTLSWTNPSDLSGIAGVYYKFDSPPTSDNDGVYVAGADITSVRNIQAPTDGQHCVYVWLRDLAGNANRNNASQTVLYLDTVPPNPPENLTASPGFSSVDNFTVSWTNPADASGIVGAYFKLDSPPTSPTDGIYVAGDNISCISGIRVSTVGEHWIYVWLRDNAGNENFEHWSAVSVYLSPPPRAPVIVRSSHPDQNKWYNDNNLYLEWSCALEGDLSIVGYSYCLDNIPDNIPDNEIDTTENYISENLADGIWYFHIKARDNTGSWGDTTHFRIQIDTVPPAGTVLIDNGAEYTRFRNVILTLSWSDDASGVVCVSYSNGGQSWTDWIAPENTRAWTLSEGDGLKTVYYQVKDAAGNTVTVSDNIILDSTPDSIPGLGSPTHPNQDGWYSNNSPRFEWGIPSSTSPIVGYSFLLDRTENTVPDENLEITDNSENYYVSGQLADGVWYFHVRAKDAAGNWGPSAHFGVQIDNTPDGPPAVFSPTHPDPSKWYNKNTWIGFQWSPASPTAPVVGFLYYIDENPDTVPENGMDGEFTTDNQVYIPYCSDGTWYFHIRQKDAAGHWGQTAHFRFNIDTKPPVAPILSWPTNGSIIANNRPTFTWEHQEKENIENYELEIYDNAGSLFLAAVSSVSFYELQNTLPDNQYRWRVRATDRAGNKGDWSENFVLVIDSTPPSAPQLIAPENNCRMHVPVATFAWEQASDMTSVTYELQVSNDESFSSMVLWVRGLVENFYSPPVILTGTFYWRVRAIDAARNVGNWSEVWMFTNYCHPPRVTSVLVDGKLNPRKVATDRPLISWTFVDEDNDSQLGVQIQVDAGFPSKLNRRWDYLDENLTGNGIQYAGQDLDRRTIHYVRIRVRDNTGVWGPWSDYYNFMLNCPPRVENLKVNGQTEALYISTPALTWDYMDEDGDEPVASEIWLGTEPGGRDVWENVLGFTKLPVYLPQDVVCSLRENTRYYVQIRVKDGRRTGNEVAGDYSWSNWVSASFVTNLHPQITQLKINGGAQYTNSRQVELSLQVMHGAQLESLFYRVDNGEEISENFSTNKILTLEGSEGRKEIRVKVRDALGWESQENRVSIILDLTPPTGLSGVSPSDGSCVGVSPVRLSWTMATDSISGVALPYILEVSTNESFTNILTSVSTEKTYYDLPLGDQKTTLYWRIRVRDRAGNESCSPAYRFSYDPTPPSLTPTLVGHATGTTIVNNPHIQILLSGANVGWYRYGFSSDSVLTASWVPYAEGVLELTLDREGQHMIYFQAKSPAGVIGDPVVVPVFLDLSAPYLELKADNVASSSAIRTLYFFTTDMGGSGVSQMRLRFAGENWGPWENFQSKRVLQLREGLNVVEAQVRDRAGNESIVARLELYYSVGPTALTKVVVVDNLEREEEVSLEDLPTVLTRPTCTLKIPAKPGVFLFVNGERIEPKDGYWVVNLTLREGKNAFTFSTVDLAGATWSKSLEFIYSPERAKPKLGGSFPIFLFSLAGAGGLGIMLALRLRRARKPPVMVPKTFAIRPKAVKPFVREKGERPKEDD